MLNLTKGYDVPPNAHPTMIGKEDGSRTNYSQLLPYTSKDVRDYDGIYRDLEAVFEDVFEWIAEQVSYILPLSSACNQ